MNKPSISPAELEERTHLNNVKAKLHQAISDVDTRLSDYAQDIHAQKTYLWESRADMDHIEKISTRQSILQTVMTGETILAHRKRLSKLARAPYFGRFDFAKMGQTSPQSIYIGIHHLFDEREKTNLIYDWRAPVSTMFYDHENGAAQYESPAGDVHGLMSLKRQFRIRDGEMEFMLESSVNIMDEVLQRELSRASDDGMKNIVATIQRDQNTIIRNENAHVLIIQGVAGSGKTSIALHRIAFLLYRFKDTLTSKDILIISPNRVFGDYISNVLPELGEESVSEIGMEILAEELLDHKYRFQSFFEQTAQLLEKNDEGMKQRIQFKATREFMKQINAYAEQVEAEQFTAHELRVGRRIVPDWFIDETYKKHRGVSMTERISRVLKAVEFNISVYYNYDITTEERAILRVALKSMARQFSLRETYKKLFDWIGRPKMFKLAKGAQLEYADVFPLIYLKIRLEGIDTPRKRIKHLLIDEMQDYTPVQYAVIARLFNCKKTILGDANQSVNPYSASNAEEIERAFTQASCVKLTKSYRSTFEIMQFAQAISPNPDLVAIERHGDAPQLVKCASKAQELKHVYAAIVRLANSEHNTLGIILKTQKQAEKLISAIQAAGHEARLLSEQSATFSSGVVVCAAHMAKGLEFDQVLIPHVDKKNYATMMDKNMLYVACTRAMHNLTLTYTDELTGFIAI